MLDLVLINTETSGTGSPVTCWNYVSSSGTLTLPSVSEYVVSVNGQPVSVVSSGFKRRPLSAPLAVRDLRIENHLYLQLSSSIADNSVVTVTNPDQTVWASSVIFSSTSAPLRYSPAIHVNEEGYTTALPKKAMVGYYLGSMGELPITAGSPFSLVSATTGQVVYTGTLTLRADVGYTYTPTPYQQVWQADFSSFTTPGTYQLQVPGMGASLPFVIDNSLVMGFARAYEQGIYNQRSGSSIVLPYSRFTRPPDHTAPAFIPIPQSSFVNAWNDLTSDNSTYPNDPRETAPLMVSPATALYPFVNTGTVNVAGGHFDAGDYSKYITDSAAFVHYLIFAVDNIPGAAALDNLGIPQSGDGISDLMQEAKIESDFIAEMQDADGGFYFLVYPENRKYENNVLPQNGDPQVVFPKNTSGTAAAVAVLAEMASSPTFKAAYPQVAAQYLQQANAGWTFLMNAIAQYGINGSYQQITPYGDVFMHYDELSWAAAALFVATGNPAYQTQLEQWYPNPNDSSTFRWTWWRMFEGYGCACRDFAFAVQSGRLTASQVDPNYLAACQQEVVLGGSDALLRSQQCAYGSAFDSDSKRCQTAGWYFSSDRAFDMTAAYLLDPNPSFVDSILTNMNFEGGCNPQNLSYIEGLGVKRQHDIVSQIYQNDKRRLPPSGILVGNLIQGFAWLNNYGSDLGALTFPNDGLSSGQFPFYDRWGDSYNTTAEMETENLARALAAVTLLAAQTPAASVAWTPPNGTISVPAGYSVAGQPMTASLSIPGMDLTGARVVWETGGQAPQFSGSTWTFSPVGTGSQWLEAEAAWPDGRRVASATTFQTCASVGFPALTSDSNTIALYHFNGSYADSGTNGLTLTAAGNTVLTSSNTGWNPNPSGEVVRFSNLGDTLSVTVPYTLLFPKASAAPLSLEVLIYPRAYKAYSVSNYAVASLFQNYDATLEVEDGKWDSPAVPFVYGAATTVLTAAQWNSAVALNTWHSVKLTLTSAGLVSCYIDGNLISSSTVSFNFGRKTNWVFTLGNEDADMAEFRVSNIVR